MTFILKVFVCLRNILKHICLIVNVVWNINQFFFQYVVHMYLINVSFKEITKSCYLNDRIHDMFYCLDDSPH